MRRLIKTLFLFTALTAASAAFFGCAGDNSDSDGDSCGSGVCPAIFGPVCVLTDSGANCYVENDCVATGCDMEILCTLNLDAKGAIDPASTCAKTHPACVNKCGK
jgi:hypothetical protein